MTFAQAEIDQATACVWAMACIQAVACEHSVACIQVMTFAQAEVNIYILPLMDALYFSHLFRRKQHRQQRY